MPCGGKQGCGRSGGNDLTKILQFSRRRLTHRASPRVKRRDNEVSMTPSGRWVQNKIWEIVMEINISWTTPVACEVCVGMEVTSYMSAEI
jgi:coenzyme PQQ precursor peptide PqqA